MSKKTKEKPIKILGATPEGACNFIKVNFNELRDRNIKNGLPYKNIIENFKSKNVDNSGSINKVEAKKLLGKISHTNLNFDNIYKTISAGENEIDLHQWLIFNYLSDANKLKFITSYDSLKFKENIDKFKEEFKKICNIEELLQQQPASRQESQFNIPLTPQQQPSSSQTPPQQPSTSQTPPQTPRTKTSLNFIKIKKKLKENFADRQTDLKQKMMEGNSDDDVNKYIEILCNTVNLNLGNLIPQDKKMLKLLHKINLFHMIILNTNFNNDKSFKLLLQEKHQTNINNKITELCNEINNLIRNNNENNNESSYKNKILAFCNKLEEFLQLLQEIINGIKKDLKIKLFQEEYKSKNTLKSNTTDFFIKNKTEVKKKLKSHDNSIIKMIKNYYKINEEDPYIHSDINKIDIDEFLKNKKMSLNSNQINTLFYLYDKIMTKQKAQNSDKIIQAFKRLIYKHLTYEIENVLPVYEYLDPVKIYKE